MSSANLVKKNISYYHNQKFFNENFIITTKNKNFVYKYKCNYCSKFKHCEEYTGIQDKCVYFRCYDCKTMNDCIGCGKLCGGGLCNNCRQNTLYK